MTTEQKWEYKVLCWNSWDWPLLERTLNDLGDAGWEVAATMADTIVLKRPSDSRGPGNRIDLGNGRESREARP